MSVYTINDNQLKTSLLDPMLRDEKKSFCDRVTKLALDAIKGLTYVGEKLKSCWLNFVSWAWPSKPVTESALVDYPLTENPLTERVLAGHPLTESALKDLPPLSEEELPPILKEVLEIKRTAAKRSQETPEEVRDPSDWDADTKASSLFSAKHLTAQALQPKRGAIQLCQRATLGISLTVSSEYSSAGSSAGEQLK